MRITSTFCSSMVSLILLLGCRASDEGSGSSGGDGVRGVFLEAQTFAVDAVGESSGASRTQLVSDVVSQWVTDHQKELALDIRISRHIWTNEPSATCASTRRVPNADIILSVPSCREDIKEKARAAFTLIHESVHHFGIEDEFFADQVARSIIGDQKRPSEDRTEGFSAPQPREVEFNNQAAESLSDNYCKYLGLNYDVETAHRPGAEVTYHDGSMWQSINDDSLRIQRIDENHYKILTNGFLVYAPASEVSECPLIDIRLKWM